MYVLIIYVIYEPVSNAWVQLCGLTGLSRGVFYNWYQSLIVLYCMTVFAGTEAS